MLEKTVSVFAIAEPGDHRENALLFTSYVKPGDDARRFTEIYLDEGVWREMGEPDTITATFQVGDTLNTANTAYAGEKLRD